MDWTATLPWILFLGAVAVAIYSQIVGRGVWRDVAEAREQEIKDLEKRIDALEARVDVLQGDFARDIADRVVEEIKDRII